MKHEPTLPRFDEGDRIELRGHTYDVDRVDVIPARDAPDRVIQYVLDPVGDAPDATLHPEGDGRDDAVFVVQEFHSVDPDDVTAVDS